MAAPIRFRPGVTARVISPQEVFLSDGTVGQAVVNPFLVPLIPYLESGEKGRDELALLLQSRQAPSVTLKVIEGLGNWLESVPLTGPPHLQAFWSRVASQSPPCCSVSMIVLTGVPLGGGGGITGVPLGGGGSPDWVARWRMRLEGHPWLQWVDAHGDIEVAVCADYRQKALGDYASRRGARPWLPLRLGGTSVWLGPLLGHPDSPNWSDLVSALSRNHPVGSWLAQRLSAEEAFERPSSWSAAALGVGLELAFLELERALCRPEASRRQLAVYDAHENRLTLHSIPQVPPKPVSNSKPSLRADRLLSPEELWPLLEPLVDEHLGLAVRLQEVEPVRVPFPCYYATSLEPVQAKYSIDGAVQQTQVGRAARPWLARLGALAETVERSSGRFHEADMVEMATFEGLGERAIHPYRYLLFSERQYAQRRAGQGFHLNTVPEPFDEDKPVLWSPVRSLTAGVLRLLPTSLLYYSSGRLREDPGAPSLIVDSNGSASGGCLEEAIWHGLLEVIERDAVGIWWYNRLSRPALDLTRFGPAVESLVKHFEASGEQVWALDLTHDLGVTVVAVVSIRGAGRQEPALGFGCHNDPEKAVLSALHEAIQWSTAYERRVLQPDGQWQHFRLSRSPLSTTQELEVLDWIEAHDTGTDPHLLPSPEPVRGPGDLPTWEPASTFQGEIDNLQARLERRGLEVLVLDQSRPAYPLRSVKVIVPGLRSLWRRLAPGRLYQVPVELGWLDRPQCEEDLNPTSIFL